MVEVNSWQHAAGSAIIFMPAAFSPTTNCFEIIPLEVSWQTQLWRDFVTSNSQVCRKRGVRKRECNSSGPWRGAPDGVATLKVRKGAFDALNKGSGASGKGKLSPPRVRPLTNSMLNSLILRLFAFVCVCSRLRAFICVLGPFQRAWNPRLSAFARFRSRLQTLPLILPPFAAPWHTLKKEGPFRRMSRKKDSWNKKGISLLSK